MYILQIDLRNQSDLLLVLAATVLIQCIILYYVIKIAVRDANKPLLKELKRLNYLKIHEFKLNGLSEQDVQGIPTTLDAIEEQLGEKEPDNRYP
jgi:hypothetical protein